MDQVNEIEEQLEHQETDRIADHREDHADDRFVDRFEDHFDERPDAPRPERPDTQEDELDASREQASSAVTDPASSPVTVDIYDQAYHLRGQDPAYITQLALIVDSKMRAVAAGGTTVDSLRVAVLAALNIADQLVRTEAQYRALRGSISETETTIRHRAENLSGLLDDILTEDRKVG